MASKRHTSYKELTITPTISASVAYTASDNIGGLMEFVLKDFNAGGLIHSIYAVDIDDQAAAIDFYVFSGQPGATFTDNAAFPALGAADGLLLRGIVSMQATDYTDIGSVSWGRVLATDPKLADQIGLRASAGSVWIAAKAVGTPTYTTTASLKITLVSKND
jgi:hypothetical protein